MKTEFENDFCEPASPDFFEQLLQQLYPGRKPGEEHTIYLELVNNPRGLATWFMFGQNKTQTTRDTMQLIQITVKRIR